MTLNGTLSDLGIVDLIQFPSSGRKTGELKIVDRDREARLYYNRGRLEHVVSGDRKGMDALTDIVCWEQGEFKFLLGHEADEQSLNLDLHRALMHALKIRDELAERNRQKPNRMPSVAPPDPIQVCLEKFIEDNAPVQGVYLLSDSGTVLAKAAGGKSPQAKLAAAIEAVKQFIQAHHDAQFQRVLLEGELGTLAAVMLSSGAFSLLIADKDTALGAVSMTANRLAQALEEIAK